MNAPTTIMAAAMAFAGVPAFAGSTYNFNWQQGDGGATVSNAAGEFEEVRGSYNSTNHTFNWEVTFGDRRTNALTLAVSPGANPKSNPGQLAIFYLADGAYQPEGLTLSAYGYNGANNASSFFDGDASNPGVQSPDLIHSSEQDSSWIMDLSKENLSGGRRRFSFTVDASAIMGHDPLYPDGDDPWTGVSFGEEIGIWMHSWDNRGAPGADYGPDDALQGWNFGRQGWFDGSHMQTSVVPVPPAVALGLVGLGGLVAARRRRA